MYPVPESLSDPFKKVVYAKECGLCNVCGRTCRNTSYRIVSSEYYSRENLGKLYLFFLQHDTCDEIKNEKEMKSILLKHPSVVIFSIGFIVAFYGFYTLFSKANAVPIFLGVVLVFIGRVLYKFEQEQKDNSQLPKGIRSHEEIQHERFRLAHNLSQKAKKNLNKNLLGLVKIIFFIVILMVMAVIVLLFFVYLSKNLGSAFHYY